MAGSHGRFAQFSLEDGTTTARMLRDWLTNISMPRAVDTAETTVFSTTDKTYVIGARGATIGLSGIWDSTIDGYLGPIVGKEKDFIYFPNTTEASAVKYYGSAIVTAYDIPLSVTAAVTWTATLQVTGAITRGTV
ncbi:MAG: hypothetical protein WC359_15050 [Dehalococcoidia bacterium]|jgi:hypothetical protein